MLRWEFPDPHEARAREEAVKKIDGWWKEFQSRERDLDAQFNNRKEWDLPLWMKQNLEAIHHDLMWEFGPGPQGGHRLVITAEAHARLRPLVRAILKRAPKIEGWSFCPYRLPENLEIALEKVRALRGGDVRKTMVDARIGEFNRIDLFFYLPQCKGPEDRLAKSNAIVATEALLGGEVLDKRIGGITVDRLKEGQGELISLDQLKLKVDGLLKNVMDKLPDKPLHQLKDPDKGAVFSREPKKAKEYPGWSDLFVASTGYPQWWEAAHESGAFYSERYSKFNELFCYLKLDGRQKLEGETFPDRSSIQDAIDGPLRDKKLGCVMGGGTGLRYSYIDLALTDVPSAAEIIRKVLREGKITKRCWLLFFDRDLQDEWIGIWDDTPEPPRP